MKEFRWMPFNSSKREGYKILVDETNNQFLTQAGSPDVTD